MMGLSVGKLRVGLLVAAGLLLVVVLGFLGYARRAGRQFVKSLPKRLGMDITSETDNFTYSQSLGPHTKFTIHAAKEYQHTNGKVTLHDVGIVLYGANGDRADHIYGDEFEYDDKAGIVKAVGDVRIDLQAPAAAFHGKKDGGVYETGEGAGPANDAKVIHVKTRDLVFDKNKGEATTPARVDFTSGGMSGNAVGAVYSSETRVLVLQTAVHASGLMKDRPATMTASHAELDRANNLSVFTQAHYVSPGQGLVADTAVVHTTDDGSPKAMEASGHVAVTGNDRGTVNSDRLDVVLNEKGKPESAHLYGGVRYADDRAGRTSRGSSDEARVSFDEQGRASGVVMTGAVTGDEHGPAGTRRMSATKVVLGLVADGSRSVLRDADATGGAKLREVGVSNGPKPAITDLAGDELKARFETVNHQARISALRGMGHTVLHQVAETGVDQTSSGETLDMEFREARPGSTQLGAKKAVSADAKPNPQAVEIAKAVQRGGVKVLRAVPAKAGGQPEIQRASADEETYDGDTDRVTLHGRAHVEDASGAVSAETVTMERETGDATAEGGVQTSYVQGSDDPKAKNEPTHVLADHARFDHDLGTAFFYAAPGKVARMWQAGSQVEAPELDLVRTDDRRQMIAHGDAGQDGAVVHAVLVGQQGKKADDAGPVKMSVVHVASHRMLYTDETRQVELTGKVRVDDPDGVVVSDHATVFLTPASAVGAAKMAPAGGAFMGGQVQRVVAGGDVRVEQPGRHAEGQELVYTADDRTFVMTGTKAAPPKMVSDGRNGDTPGTVVGSSLRFRSGDNSVLVQGGDAKDGPQRVTTETRMKPETKSGATSPKKVKP